MANAANDMPRDAGEEEEVWDAERIREQIDDLRARRGRHVYTIAALHAASGEVAAHTDVEADPESPQWGFQLLTAVTRRTGGTGSGCWSRPRCSSGWRWPSRSLSAS